MPDLIPIWFNPSLSLADLRAMGTVYMSALLDMRWEFLTENSISLSMPVDDRTKQPYGLLHGGASCALAETVGSVASHLVIDQKSFICMGQEINASHLKSVTGGRIIATASPLHLGKTTHVWDIRIKDESEKLICISRLTVAIRPKT